MYASHFSSYNKGANLTATPGKDEGGASMVAWTGMSSLLLLCASLML